MTTPEMFDVIVVGGGPMGLASAYECSVIKGKKVLLLERFNNFANVYGSSPGYSRQFRVSYSENNLCELALDTYDMWKDLETIMDGQTLLQETGCLWFGDSGVASGEGNIDLAISNLRAQGLTEPDDFTVLTGKEEIMKDKRFSFVSKAVADPDIETAKALFTVKGGTLNVPAIVKGYVEKLRSKATLMKNARVTKIDRSNQNYVEIKAEVKVGNKGPTTDKTYRGKKIILTPGAYVNDVLSRLDPPFQYRINMTIYLWSSTYFVSKDHEKTEHPSEISNPPAKWPIWYFFGPKPAVDNNSDDPKDFNDYYGFPSEPSRPEYLRVAPAFTSEKKFDFSDFPPEINDRPLDENALGFTSKFVENFMPDLCSSLKEEENSTCIAGFVELLKEDAIDEGAGFLMDFLPNDKRIVVFTGGWAMKFVPMFGKLLSDLAIHGKTDAKYEKLIEPMNISRGVLENASLCQSNKLKASSCTCAKKAATFRKIWC